MVAWGWGEGSMGPLEVWEGTFQVPGKHSHSLGDTSEERGISSCCLPNSCHPFAVPADSGWLLEVAGANARTGPWVVWGKAAHKGSCCVDRWSEGTVEAESASQVFLAASCHRHNSVQVEGHHTRAVAAAAVGSTDHWDSSSHLKANKRKC